MWTSCTWTHSTHLGSRAVGRSTCLCFRTDGPSQAAPISHPVSFTDAPRSGRCWKSSCNSGVGIAASSNRWPGICWGTSSTTPSRKARELPCPAGKRKRSRLNTTAKAMIRTTAVFSFSRRTSFRPAWGCSCCCGTMSAPTIRSCWRWRNTRSRSCWRAASTIRLAAV